MSKVLLVEDNEILRGTLRRLLERNTFEVEEAGDGEQGIEAVLRGGIDLVITDFKMPKLNGWELIEKIHETSPHFPLIMISAQFPDDIDVLEDVVFLKKPFEYDKLIELAKGLLDAE